MRKLINILVISILGFYTTAFIVGLISNGLATTSPLWPVAESILGVARNPITLVISSVLAILQILQSRHEKRRWFGIGLLIISLFILFGMLFIHWFIHFLGIEHSW